MEVLISIFVLLFGLMGVAAIFPVGNHYVVEGEKFDQGSILAQNAFEELQARGMLRPDRWLYADHVDANTPGTSLIDQSTGWYLPALAPPIGPGHAFVLDPMGGAATIPGNGRAYFPWHGADPNNPWAATLLFPPLPPGSVTERWPVRRMTLPIPDPTGTYASRPMTTPVAETIFRLRDDLAVELPERDDAPGIQRWNTFDVNGTPNNPNDDALLTRQYQGNFSWLATLVPHTTEALLALQPAYPASAGYLYDVSVVVFYKRDTTPSAASERLLRAELTAQGEVVLYGDSFAEVDKALEEIKAGDWIALMGVNQASGAFMLKWYRLLSLDEETYVDQVQTTASPLPMRRAMLNGPDWPATHNPTPPPPFLQFIGNLRAAIVPGVASVVTRQMTLEKDSAWSGN